MDENETLSSTIPTLEQMPRQSLGASVSQDVVVQIEEAPVPIWHGNVLSKKKQILQKRNSFFR